MRHVTDTGLELVRAFEGFSAEPYICAGGCWTIGFGAIRGPDGRPVTAATPPIDEDEAADLLGRDIEAAERAVLRLIRVPLDDGQFDALASFTFNLGAGRLQSSTLRAKVNREEHEDVPAEFRRWVFGGGRKLPGLVRRRAAEAAMYAA